MERIILDKDAKLTSIVKKSFKLLLIVMKKNTKKNNISNPTTNIQDVITILPKEESKWVNDNHDFLMECWNKKQIFRTETDMRLGVLNSFKHPTPAAKYWQSVRELEAQFSSLIIDSFDIRRLNIKKLRLQKKLETAIQRDDELKIMEIRIDLEEILFNLASATQSASDRVRELKTWQRIINELDDGTFDTKNPNTHQALSHSEYWKNRQKSLTEHSDHSDIINVMGSVQNVNDLVESDGKLLNFIELKNKQLNLESSNKNNILEETDSSGKILDFRKK